MVTSESILVAPTAACVLTRTQPYSPLHGMFAIPVDEVLEPSLERVAKVYGLNQLDSATQTRAFRETLDAILLYQAAHSVAFRHEHVTPFPTLGVDRVLRFNHGDIIRLASQHPLALRVIWMTQVAMAIAHLHANGVVHGHVWPGSILVKDDGRATITNAAAYTEACGALYPYIRCIPVQESFVYQAPEFIRMDNPGLPTQAMDVYAFGSTLYAVLTGVAPFHARSRPLITTVAEIGKYGHMAIPQPAAEAISDGLWAIIQQCWETNPAARPRMADVVAALRALQ